jgi:hypothetical protein
MLSEATRGAGARCPPARSARKVPSIDAHAAWWMVHGLNKS